LSEEKSKWQAIGSAPISSEAPSGNSIRYDPEFEQLQTEMQKLENLSGDPVDWKKVVTLSGSILQKKSKDLLVGSYLILALLETEGIQGLSKGLACLEGIISEHWLSLFPVEKRMRARINALNWLSERTGAAISRIPPAQENAESLGACEEQVKSLEVLLKGKIGPESPELAELYRAIQEQLNRLSTARSDASGSGLEEKAKIEAKPASAATGLATKLDTKEDAKRALKESLGTLKRVISFTRSQDPTNPFSYRLIRAITWCEIDNPPPAANGKSRLPSPPNQLRERLQALAEQAAWKELVSQAESRVAEFPFWFDLHRMSETALAALGADYVHARQALKSEVATLLLRLPVLMELEFSDGTPFANEATQKWVSTYILPTDDIKSQDDVKSEVAGTAEGEIGLLDEVRTKSRQFLQEGKLKDGLSVVQDALRSASTQRQRFFIQLELVNLCIEADQVKAALANLEMLDEQIARFSLDTWEPQLASQVLQVYLHTLNRALRESKQPAPELSRIADSVYGRLCRLDILAGLNTAKRS
jgi:type VI secretion system protein VasJ